MTTLTAALVVAVAAPWIASVIMFSLAEESARSRMIVGVVAAGIATGSALVVGAHVASGGEAASVGIPLLGFSFGLAADRLGVLFAVVAGGLWLVTTIYATGYMSHGKDRARFFGFFAICVGSAIGIALSANLLTLFVFYEALTLATYPLVVHSGTEAAARGGRTYLYYALSGGVVLALGIIWLYALGGGGDFAAGGTLPATLVQEHAAQLTVVFALLIAGFGVKAALFPAHGWLPAAMVAPAPVSALLHAVAVVKAGVFGIARVVLDVYGADAAGTLGVLLPLAVLAAFTLLFGSVRALAQDDIKKRLAYSTIAQLSYIVLGLAIGTPVAAAAALAHLAHHALLKITMFFTAGTLAEELKVYRVSQMNGVGKRMPLTMTAFTIAALGITGVPPIAGFVSKWGLGLGGLQAGESWPLAVLAVSSVLNAAYFMPMLGRAWFAKSEHGVAPAVRPEGDRRLVWPLTLTAFLGLLAGPLAAASWAPASWAAAATGASTSLVVPWRTDLIRLDTPGALFLLLAVVVWIAAALGAWKGVLAVSLRFQVFFGLAAAGSIGLAFAQDAAFFYACFSVMALSAYGLIAHEDEPGARRAGRVYLAFTVVAEACLLVGLMIGSLGEGTVAETLAGSPWLFVGAAMLLLAFGIKIGAVGLHGWMPGAYHAAPAGSGAALAGVASSAGILGLVRFLPGGAVELADWGVPVMVLGLIAAFWGAAAGILQREPRHVLAYSSMSQFGLMTVGIGAGLSAPEHWPAAAAAVALYMMHHGFAKAALFAAEDLAASSRFSWSLAVAVGVPGLALTGLPLTSGGVAKVALKGVAAHAPETWAHALEMLLPLAAVGTTLLVARFLVLSLGRSAAVGWASAPYTTRSSDNGLRLVAFVSIAIFVLGTVWLAGDEAIAYAAHKSLTMHYVWILSWPVALGALLGVTGWLARRSLLWAEGAAPPGDVWAVPLRLADETWVAYQERLVMPPSSAAPAAPVRRVAKSLSSAGVTLISRAEEIESRLLTWQVASGILVALALLAFVLA